MKNRTDAKGSRRERERECVCVSVKVYLKVEVHKSDKMSHTGVNSHSKMANVDVESLSGCLRMA